MSNNSDKPDAEFGLATGAAMDTTSLVEYADGSIVSRALIDNKSGSITLFAFAKGQALSEHSTPHHAFVEVLDGAAEFTIGGKRVAAHKGQLLVLPADIPHAVRAEENFKMALTMLRT